MATDEDLAKQKRTLVETLAGYGMAPEEIALLLVPPMDADTLKRDYAVELEMGPAKANLETVSMLRGAVKKGNVTAAIYWTKARMGWTEKAPATKGQPGDEEPAPVKLPTAKEMRAILHILPRSSQKS